MVEETKKTEPDNIDRCVIAAKEISERKGRLVIYGEYMAKYHNERYPFNKRKKKAKK